MANSIVLEKLSSRNLLFLFAGNLVILIILCVAGGKGKIFTFVLNYCSSVSYFEYANPYLPDISD